MQVAENPSKPVQRFRSFTRVLLLGAVLLCCLVVLYWRIGGPAEPAWITVAEDPATVLAGLGKPHRIYVEHDLHYPGGDGSPIAYDLYAPDDYKSVQYPILIWIHGGGWSIGDKSNGLSATYSTHAARLGFVALNINYRLDTPAKRAAFPIANDDIAAFVAYLKRNLLLFNANAKTRVSIAGHSAGGQLALFQATASEPPLAVACVVDVAGVSDLTAADFPEILAPILDAYAGDRPTRIKASPARRLAQFQARAVLLIHAQDDPVVPITQSISLMQGLRQKKPAVSISAFFPGAGGHDLVSAETNAALNGFLPAHCR
jgi:acetyl esterase/lipase